MIITSGASSARVIRYIRLFRTIQLLSSRNGTFGWTKTHVTVHVVARQLQRMSHTVRPVSVSDDSSREKTRMSWLNGSEMAADVVIVPYFRRMMKNSEIVSIVVVDSAPEEGGRSRLEAGGRGLRRDGSYRHISPCSMS